MTPTNIGLTVVGVVLLIVIVLGIMFYLGETRKARDTKALVGTQQAKVDALQAKVDAQQTELDAQQTKLDALSTSEAADVADLKQRSRGTALIVGNNGVSCPVFCNNPLRKNPDGTEVGTWDLFRQVPGMANWRGATAYRGYPQAGLCDCVEDPDTPYGSITLVDATSGGNQSYMAPGTPSASVQ